MSSRKKHKASFVERYAPKSVAYKLMIWLIFWGMYALWAGYSPTYPKSEHGEPLFALVVLGFMLTFFFLFGDKEEKKLLVANSLLSFSIVSGLLSLNLYRAFTGDVPDAWFKAGFFGSMYMFLILQFGFIVLSILLIHHTIHELKKNPLSIPIRQIVWAVGLLVLLGLLVLFFAGKLIFWDGGSP